MTAQIISIANAKKEKTWVKASQNMVLHRPTGIYYLRKYKAGRGRIFKTTGESRKGRAQTLADEMQAEWMGGERLGGRRYDIGTLVDLLDEKLASDPKRRRKTRLHDKTYLPLIKKYFGNEWADEIDELYWEQWVLRTGNGLDRTLGDIAKYLSKTLTFAFEHKAINRKPKISNPDPEPQDPEVFTYKEIQGFIHKAESDLKDLIQIGAETGIRPTENRELRWDWISPDLKTVRFPETFTKTKKAREIYLSPGAQQILTQRSKKRQGPYVFSAPKDPLKPLSECQLSRMWRRMLGVSKGERAPKFHWLRHSFGSVALLEAGKPLPMVAAYMGNSPKVLFDRYLAKDASRTEDLSKVLSFSGGKLVKRKKNRKEIK